MEAPAGDHLVHEAIGPALSGLEAGVALGMGVNGLLVLGVLPVVACPIWPNSRK